MNVKTNRDLLQGNRALILLARGFEEIPIIYYLDQMREAGLPISSVGLAAGLVRGTHGVDVLPDFSLEKLPSPFFFSLVIIPDGQECLTALLADPRVHRLIQTTISNRGYIAAMPVAETKLRQAGLLDDCSEPQFILQKETSLEQFTSQLINLMISNETNKRL